MYSLPRWLIWLLSFFGKPDDRFGARKVLVPKPLLVGMDRRQVNPLHKYSVRLTDLHAGDTIQRFHQGKPIRVVTLKSEPYYVVRYWSHGDYVQGWRADAEDGSELYLDDIGIVPYSRNSFHDSHFCLPEPFDPTFGTNFY